MAIIQGITKTQQVVTQKTVTATQINVTHMEAAFDPNSTRATYFTVEYEIGQTVDGEFEAIEVGQHTIDDGELVKQMLTAPNSAPDGLWNAMEEDIVQYLVDKNIV